MRLLILASLFIAIVIGTCGYRLARFYALVKGW